MLALEGMMNAQRNRGMYPQTSLSVTAGVPMRRQAQRSSQRNGTSVVTEMKSQQAAKIRELGQSLIDAGFVTIAGWGFFRPDQMKPRTVYEKAVQDFTETAQQLARLNQRFRGASFAEFEMLMALDDEVLKRYGLPKSMVERALIKVYETVVLGQQR